MRNKLTNIQIKNAPSGKLQDGGGLILVKSGETGKWVYRYSHLGRRREMGLGPWPTLSLAAARSARDQWAMQLAAGNDPIAIRKQAQAEELVEAQKDDPTFAQLAEMVLEARHASLRGDGRRGRWMSPLALYVTPKIGRKPISTIATADIVAAIKPIWRTKHPTAKKAIERTRIVFTEGRFMGFDCDPFTVDAARRQLGLVSHVEEPMPSTPWQEMPALYKALDSGSASHDCLRFLR